MKWLWPSKLGWRRIKKIKLNIVSLQCKMWTQYIPNIKQKCHPIYHNIRYLYITRSWGLFCINASTRLNFYCFVHFSFCCFVT
jgi:hypothetical protein